MTYSEQIKKEIKSLSKKDILGMSILAGIFIIAVLMLPIVADQSNSLIKDRINNAKTCSDLYSADQVPFVSATFLSISDPNQSIQKLIDDKAHVLCKTLYDLQKKYGDITLSDLPKISCSDLAVLIHNVSTRQEVINEYVSRCVS